MYLNAVLKYVGMCLYRLQLSRHTHAWYACYFQPKQKSVGRKQTHASSPYPYPAGGSQYFLQSKSLYISRAVSSFYGTEFEIWAGGTVNILEQQVLSAFCLLCYHQTYLFIGRFGRATCTVHLISAPDQPGRKQVYFSVPLHKKS